MRPLKIISLLFSLGQFLLILKLIELVRGSPPPPPTATPPREIFRSLGNLPTSRRDNPSPIFQHRQANAIANQNSDSGRSFFLSANSKKKQKKYKLWTDSPTTITINPSDDTYDTTPTPTTENLVHVESLEGENSTAPTTNSATNKGRLELASVGVDVDKNALTESDNGDTLEGRLCPGCEGGTCGGAVKPYGYPVIPVVIALIVGVAWFIIFLFLWYYAIVPEKSHSTSTSSGGYGYGDSQSQSAGGGGGGWSHESEGSSGSGSETGFGLSSIFDIFKGDKNNQRSMENFNHLTTIINEALTTFPKIYNTFTQ